MDEVIDYIKQFLVYGNEKVAEQIGYTADEAEWDKYQVVIVPGRNILTGAKHDWTEPNLSEPAKAEKTGEFTDEFGETTGGTWVIRQDIIYNTLYCISYPGNGEKDQHGRTPSGATALGKQGLWTIPVVDEYARLVTKLLEAPLPEQHFTRIVLSHDVDTIAHYRHLRGFLGALKRGQLKVALGALTDLESDPAYTFPWLHNRDSRVPGAEEMYFLKATEGKGHDYPQYNLQGKDCKVLLEHLQNIDATIGLHGSYYAEDQLSYAEEKKRLEATLGTAVSCHRNHYLRLDNPDALQALADAGITDDYTAGWADHVGFALGTTRPVRWINPKTLRLTSLTRHPLCLMDCTLSNETYMNIQDEEEAYYVCQQVIDKVRQHGGELVLLWHNSSVEEDGYQKQLYKDITDYLSE